MRILFNVEEKVPILVMGRQRVLLIWVMGRHRESTGLGDGKAERVLVWVMGRQREYWSG